LSLCKLPSLMNNNAIVFLFSCGFSNGLAIKKNVAHNLGILSLLVVKIGG
jgi:hypothetical protein